MAYVDPEMVDSPKSSIRNLKVRHNQGKWAVAEFDWEDEAVVGIRWNGTDGEPGVGSPQSRGHPTWFIVPGELADAVRARVDGLSKGGRDKIAEGYRAMARDREREAEAKDWTEELIADADDSKR